MNYGYDRATRRPLNEGSLGPCNERPTKHREQPRPILLSAIVTSGCRGKYIYGGGKDNHTQVPDCGITPIPKPSRRQEMVDHGVEDLDCNVDDDCSDLGIFLISSARDDLTTSDSRRPRVLCGSTYATKVVSLDPLA